MPTTGSGTMSSISVPTLPGSGPYLGFAPPLRYTQLSLDRYARILGINPAHFWGGFGQEIWPVGTGCDDLWPRHSWQKGDAVSREELAITIKEAEAEIARYVRFPLSPQWFEDVLIYPKPYRKEFVGYGGRNVRGMHKSVIAPWHKVIQPGVQVRTFINTVEVVYSDEDGDGFYETATIDCDVSGLNLASPNVNEIKVFIAGTGGHPDWELRDVRSKTSTSAVATIKMNSWILIEPELKASYPTLDGFNGVDIGTSTDNFVDSVDVYRVYTDATQATARFYWEAEPNGSLPFSTNCVACSGTGCDVCGLISQDGCSYVRDGEAGIICPVPASYNSDTSAWNHATQTIGRDPDLVKVWYLAGNISQEYLAGYSYDPLSDYWAEAIAWLATARLERPLCGCGNTVALADHWRTDVAYNGDDSSYLVDFKMLANPFGTKQGELMAWKRVSAFQNKGFDGAMV